MKLLTSVIALTISITSLNVMASNVVYKPMNQNLETQACLLAATQGLDAARDLVVSNDQNFGVFKQIVTCNGMSLNGFAKQESISDVQNDTAETRKVTLVARNSRVESQLCVDAIAIGEEQAREKYGIKDAAIICNNKSLSDFVDDFKKHEVEVRTFTE